MVVILNLMIGKELLEIIAGQIVTAERLLPLTRVKLSGFLYIGFFVVDDPIGFPK